MILAGKYELLDVLTIGPVQVFRGRVKSSNASVLVHLFQAHTSGLTGAASPADVTSVLRKIDPEFAGAALDAGVDSPSGYAFVVTETSKPAAVSSDQRSPLDQDQSGASGFSEGHFTQAFKVPPARMDDGPTNADHYAPGRGADAAGGSAPFSEEVKPKKELRFSEIFSAPKQPVGAERSSAGATATGAPKEEKAEELRGREDRVTKQTSEPLLVERPPAGSRDTSFTAIFGAPPAQADHKGSDADVKPSVADANFSRATPTAADRKGSSEPNASEETAFTKIFGPSPLGKNSQAGAPARAETDQVQSKSRGSGMDETAAFVVPAKSLHKIPDQRLEADASTLPSPAGLKSSDTKADAPKTVLTYQVKAPLSHREASKIIPAVGTSAPRVPEKPSADYSDLFADLDASTPPAGPSAVASDRVAKAEPGSFTQLFSTPLGVGERTNSTTPKKEPAPGSFTNMFSAPSRPANDKDAFSSKPLAAAEPEPAPGSFTQLFSPKPHPNNADTFGPSAGEKAPVGSFTQLFGSAPVAPESQTYKPTAEEKPGSFTGIFQEPAKEPLSFKQEAPSSTDFMRPKEDRAPTPLEPPNADVGAPVSQPVASSSSATQLFHVSAQSNPQPQVAPGESEFTRVIKGSEIAAAKREVAGQQAKSPAGHGPVAAVPAVLPMSAPAAPQAPKAPPVSAPPPVPAPKIEAKKVSYLPLITALLGLMVLALLIVVIFLVKR